MMSKIITFQKMLYRLYFSRSSLHSISNGNNSIKKAEVIIQPLCCMLVYISGMKLFSGMIMTILFAFWLQMFIFQLIYQGNFVFQLPLKRSFVIKNIYFFTTLSILIISVLILIILMIFFITDIISKFIHGDKFPYMDIYHIAFFQNCIFVIACSLAYLNGMITLYFIQNAKIRIALCMIFTLAVSGLNLFITSSLTKRANEAYFNFTTMLAQMHNSWDYVGICLGVAIVVSVSGMLVALKINRPKKTYGALT